MIKSTEPILKKLSFLLVEYLHYFFIRSKCIHLNTERWKATPKEKTVSWSLFQVPFEVWNHIEECIWLQSQLKRIKECRHLCDTFSQLTQTMKSTLLTWKEKLQCTTTFSRFLYFVKTYKCSVRSLECYDCCSSSAVMQCCFTPFDLHVFSKKRWKYFQKKSCSIFWNARHRIITDYVKTTVFLQRIIYREQLAGIGSPFVFSTGKHIEPVCFADLQRNHINSQQGS